MNTDAIPKELYLLLRTDGALVTYQEKARPWVSLVGFSSTESAREFCRLGGLEGCEIAAIDTADRESVAALISQVKTRAIRNLLLDLDYRKGGCIQVEFEGKGFGAAQERQLAASRQH